MEVLALVKGLMLNLTMLVGLVAVYGWLRDSLAQRQKPLPRMDHWSRIRHGGRGYHAYGFPTVARTYL